MIHQTTGRTVEGQHHPPQREEPPSSFRLFPAQRPDRTHTTMAGARGVTAARRLETGLLLAVLSLLLLGARAFFPAAALTPRSAGGASAVRMGALARQRGESIEGHGMSGVCGQRRSTTGWSGWVRRLWRPRAEMVWGYPLDRSTQSSSSATACSLLPAAA